MRPGSPPIRLTPLEARLLEALLLNAGHVLTAEVLVDAVTTRTRKAAIAMLKQLVYRLRSTSTRSLPSPSTSGPCLASVMP